VKLLRVCGIASVVFLLSSCGVSQFPQPSDGVVAMRGTIKDSEGAVITHAHILIRAYPAMQTAGANIENTWLQANAEGGLDTKLKPGLYDICVLEPAFVPYCRKVYAETGKPLSFNVRLQVDRTFTEHYGDTFQ
jgi:hypothetical protein